MRGDVPAGASATTLGDVAQAADVPLGNVYYYFKTKDDLIFVVDRQGVLVVADLLEGSHNAGAQSVVPAVRIQDARALLTTQDCHRRDVDPRGCQFLGEGRGLRLLGQQAHHVVDGPVIEAIDVDLGPVHVAAPGRDVTRR